jgi:methionine-rich copper-binding protein CopC
MNIQVVILSFVLTLFSSVTLAGAGHDHGHSHDPVTQQQAEQIASQFVSSLVVDGKIEPGWENIKVYKSEQKNFNGNQEWVVSYNNEAASDPNKRTIYIFLSLGGEFLGGNYTGE